MKTAEPRRADAAGPSGRRAQPVRQTRTNPPRTTSAPSRAVGGRESLGGGRSHDQPIDIFPAITHFTDAITALPKDLVRHFTLLKEVDAKIFAPEETLFQFVDAALKSSPPEPRSTRDGSSSVAPTSTPMSAQNSSTDHALGGHRAPGSLNESHASTVFDLSSVPRRNLFLHTAFKIQEMLVSLEEKNHVISTANDALSKQLARINDVWPHLENEFSDEAKWGSTSHWAYPENRINRANQAERSRRDGAAFITAAAQHLQVEEAAARSDARKQALMAKKGLKNQHHDSDADDHENKQKAEPPKKAQGASKARKGAEPATPVGLGITTSANGNPPSKRRKVENNNKTVNGGQPMERAMSSVYGGNAPKPRAASPRATPAPEPTKKRKALPTANGISKKSKTAVAATVAATVAPLIPSPTPQPHQGDKPAGRGSPAPPAAVPRPASSRARQNSIQSSAENGRPRPASSASSRPNGVAVVPPEVPIIPNGPRASAEPKTLKESTTVIKTEPNKEETNPHPLNAVNGVNKKENPPKTDDAEPIEPTHHQAQTTTTTTVVTTKSGRASKPSTPAIGSFPDSTPRSRAARNVTTTTTTTATTTTAKRSHKKGASQHAIPTRIVDEDTNSSGHGDDEGDVDADEPLYCYCNGVSYGEMVACDADDCEREWFHLDCVGLKAAPPSNMKWYCDNCKDRIKTGKKVNGR
ncbi:putative p33ing1b protein [Rosellinia necatrix]|uniref:Chromatin modification-related protein n=1 Tax=Rosellinia necatrix TaxID=77044 RepID=A0A1W2TCJ7_ROSNE|nr:putative p33ing1b protein [Rosellinia necatrix]